MRLVSCLVGRSYICTHVVGRSYICTHVVGRFYICSHVLGRSYICTHVVAIRWLWCCTLIGSHFSQHQSEQQSYCWKYSGSTQCRYSPYHLVTYLQLMVFLVSRVTYALSHSAFKLTICLQSVFGSMHSKDRQTWDMVLRVKLS